MGKQVIDVSADFNMVATTMFGLEEVLAKELVTLGARDVEPHKRAVSFTGDKGFMYKANLCLRTALHVLKPIEKFLAKTDEQLYRKIYAIDWSKYMSNDQTLAVYAVLNSDNFNHTQYVSQKIKDAIADQFRENTGRRPSVDLEKPDIVIHIHIFKDQCTLSLDSSGESLHKRGYRVDTNIAPLNEVLAAGMVILSGWDKRTNFIDPMCGSGTLVIEAAMYANNIPPGYFRDNYTFKKWNDFDAELYEQIYESAISKINDHTPNIIGSDVSRHVARKANQNIHSAKVDDVVKIKTTDFRDIELPPGRGVMIVNPPYGERMIKDEDINLLYKELGDMFKKKMQGYSCWVVSSNIEALKKVGLHPTRKITLYNGSIECKFMKYEVYEGTKKLHKIKKIED